MQITQILNWTLRFVPAIILVQTLWFKFTGAEESIYIFTTVGMEPWGRFGSGIAELIAAVLLVIPGKSVYGAVLGAGVISGAVFFHLTTLGIEVMGDGGQLFILAVATLVCCVAVIIQERKTLLTMINRIR